MGGFMIIECKDAKDQAGKLVTIALRLSVRFK